MKIGFLITARLKSSRLRLKLLKDLKGKSIVQRVIDRAKRVQNIDEVILCTSKNSQDLALVEIARDNGIYYFNGDGEDVLKRLTEAANFHNLDYIVGITGENPLFSIDHTNLIVDYISQGKHDFIYTTGLPIGTATFGLSVKAMNVVCEVKEVVNTEIWGVLVNQPDIFSVKEIPVEDYYQDPTLRITTDYFEDYQFITRLYDELGEDKIYSHYELAKLLKEKPELRKIHGHLTQDQLPEEEKKKIDTFFKENVDMIRAVKDRIYNS